MKELIKANVFKKFVLINKKDREVFENIHNLLTESVKL